MNTDLPVHSLTSETQFPLVWLLFIKSDMDSSSFPIACTVGSEQPQPQYQPTSRMLKPQADNNTFTAQSKTKIMLQRDKESFHNKNN